MVLNADVPVEIDERVPNKLARYFFIVSGHKQTIIYVNEECLEIFRAF